MVWPLTLALTYLKHVSLLDVWNDATYYIYSYIIVLFTLTAILQLINFTALEFLVY